MDLPSFPTQNQDDKPPSLVPEAIAALLEKAQRVDELTQTVELKSEVIFSLKQRIQVLEEALRLSKVKRFAPSSEQSQQTSLFDEAEVEATVDIDSAADDLNAPDCAALETEATDQGTDKKKPGRQPFSSNLPREQIFITLSDEEKVGAIDTFFTKVKEELDIIPAQIRILEYMQGKRLILDVLALFGRSHFFKIPRQQSFNFFNRIGIRQCFEYLS